MKKKILTNDEFVHQLVYDMTPSRTVSSSEEAITQRNATTTARIHEYINKAKVAAEICRYMQQFQGMRGVDKKMRAMEMARQFFQLADEPFDELMISDLIDSIILAMHHWETLRDAAIKGAKCCCYCMRDTSHHDEENSALPVTSTGDGGVTDVSKAPPMVVVDDGVGGASNNSKKARSILHGGSDYLNIAELVRSTYEAIVSDNTLMSPEERRETVIRNVLQSLSIWGMSQPPSTKTLHEMLDMFILIRDGWFAIDEDVVRHSRKLWSRIKGWCHC